MNEVERPQWHRREALGTGVAAAWALATAAIAPAWAQAPAGAPRVAVVVGNAAYPGAPLRNAVRDAQSMSAALAALGFQVVDAKDAGKAQMEAAIARARDLLKGRGGVGLFFYAGHAVQLDWRNFLLPVDASPATAQEVPRQSVDVQAAIEAFRAAGTRLNIVVLDACRDNPFGASGGAGKGLAPMDAPPGTYLAYATAPGHTADDGDPAAGNGLYTSFLLREIARPQARIEEVFKRVRLQVRRASAGKQVPWDATSLEEDFYFAQGQRVPAPSERDRDAAFDEEKVHWDRVRTSARAEDFYEFLQRHPNGPMSELAQYRLDQLARPTVRATQLQRAPNQLASGAERFKVGDAFEYDWIDRLNGDRKTTFRHKVTSIDEQGRVFMNNGTTIYDQMGNVLRNPYGTRDPAAPTIPADMQVGKRWRASYWNERDGVRYRNYHDYHVAALEEYKSPLGAFMAYKVDGRGESVAPTRINRMLSLRWIDPATMHEIYQDFRFVDPAEKTFEHRLFVMTRRWLVPRG